MNSDYIDGMTPAGMKHALAATTEAMLEAQRDPRELREEMETLLIAMVESCGGAVAVHDRCVAMVPNLRLVTRRDPGDRSTWYTTERKAD